MVYNQGCTRCPARCIRPVIRFSCRISGYLVCQIPCWLDTGYPALKSFCIIKLTLFFRLSRFSQYPPLLDTWYPPIIDQISGQIRIRGNLVHKKFFSLFLFFLFLFFYLQSGEVPSCSDPSSPTTTTFLMKNITDHKSWVQYREGVQGKTTYPCSFLLRIFQQHLISMLSENLVQLMFQFLSLKM